MVRMASENTQLTRGSYVPQPYCTVPSGCGKPTALGTESNLHNRKRVASLEDEFWSCRNQLGEGCLGTAKTKKGYKEPRRKGLS